MREELIQVLDQATLSRIEACLDDQDIKDPLFLYYQPELMRFVGQTEGPDRVQDVATVLVLTERAGSEEFEPTAKMGAAAIVLIKKMMPENWRDTPFFFDNGYICVSHDTDNVSDLRIYVRSDLVLHSSKIKHLTRAQISMSTLGRNGSLGNQIFQYLFMKLYSIRHELGLTLPGSQVSSVYKLAEDAMDEVKYPEMAFDDGTENDDLALWNAEPLENVDLFGYFQNVPDCWTSHRVFITNLFRLDEKSNQALARWTDLITEQGTRTIVACHIRRGDYVDLYSELYPFFIPIDYEWYNIWLAQMKDKHPDAVVYVATDDLDQAKAKLRIDNYITCADAPNDIELSPHIIDYEMLRRARILAMCNSTFSRSAALLAYNAQDCYLPNMRRQRFEDYNVWTSEPFWEGFSTRAREMNGQGSSLRAIRQRALRFRLENWELRRKLAAYSGDGTAS